MTLFWTLLTVWLAFSAINYRYLHRYVFTRQDFPRFHRIAAVFGALSWPISVFYQLRHLYLSALEQNAARQRRREQDIETINSFLDEYEKKYAETSD